MFTLDQVVPWGRSFDCFGTLVDWHAGFSAIRAAAGQDHARRVMAWPITRYERLWKWKRPPALPDILSTITSAAAA
jgi:hypothetical protein